LFKEAGTLSEAGKDKDAVARLEEALKADDSNTGAWMALSVLRAKTATVEEFKALFARWTQAEPNNYQAYNALGRFLEEKNLHAEAFAAYKRSLEIEWNQPFILQAAERMDKKLKPGEK
jgi:Tfp pilus assembly protein PilF